MSGVTDLENLEIRTGTILLRPWRAEDAPAVYEACQDPLIQRWTSVPRPYRLEHAEEFVTNITRQAWTTGTGAPFGVFDAETGTLLGSNGLNTIDRYQGESEVGYWIAPAARGRGVATWSTHAVAWWALQTVGSLRVQWRAEVGNHASRYVAERLGFRLEGTLRNGIWRVGGGRADAWIGSLIPGDLRAPDAPADPGSRLRRITFGAPQPRLEARTPAGERIGLRPPAPGDIDAIVATCQDEQSRFWTTVPDPYRREDGEHFVHQHVPQRWALGEGAVFAIVDDADAYIGSLALRLGPVDGIGEIGYVVAPWARGRGCASTALRALCRWAFTALGLRRIEWQAYIGNVASRRVAEKAGFTVEGTQRQVALRRGQYRDSWTGARLATDATDQLEGTGP
jgi:RimJ/RimL family protein N-acetyltransferase